MKKEPLQSELLNSGFFRFKQNHLDRSNGLLYNVRSQCR